MLVAPGIRMLMPSVVLKKDRKSTRLNCRHSQISYAGFCLKKNIPREGEALRQHARLCSGSFPGYPPSLLTPLSLSASEQCSEPHYRNLRPYRYESSSMCVI